MFGYYPLYEGGSYLAAVLLGDLGTRQEVLHISQKPYPCGRLTHGAVELALELHRQRAVRADDIAQVTVAASAFVQRLVGRPHDLSQPNPLNARLSLPFTVANALLRGRMEIADAEGAALVEPALHNLAQKVTVVVDSDLAPSNAPAPQRLEITSRAGERIVRRIDVLKGAPGRALTWDETVDKFWTCWQHANPAKPESYARQAIERLASLEQEEDICAIVRLLCPGP
jgi:2-methylcitrate dehydratase PrpD